MRISFTLLLISIFIVLLSCTKRVDEVEKIYYSEISFDSLHTVQDDRSLISILDCRDKGSEKMMSRLNSLGRVYEDSIHFYYTDISKVDSLSLIERGWKIVPFFYYNREGINIDSCFGSLLGTDIIRFIDLNEKSD
jgi:hypothetical protein